AKLYMPAVTAISHNVAVRALYERLVARGKPPLLALGAAMRKLLHLAWGVIHSGKSFDPKIALA
ncbi:MAG: IS110 family transposase, partial [Xanthomonadales bacterium]|nr:IS110 family transposase [Xanthomonadales bacterium]